MVRVWKTESLLFCLRDDPLAVFNNNNNNNNNKIETIILFVKKFKLYNNYLQDKRLKERLNIYMIIAFDYFSKFYNKW